MPTELQDATTGADGFIFPDELEKTRFVLTENAVYDAVEVREEEYSDPIEDDYEAQQQGQTPAYGRWLRVETKTTDGEQWMAAPGELIEELKTWEDPTDAGMRVTRCQKSGPAESDPYEVNVAPDPDA